MEKTDTRTYCTSRQQYNNIANETTRYHHYKLKLYIIYYRQPKYIERDKTVLYLQPLIPPKRFDPPPPPDWGILRKSKRVLFFL